MIEEFLNSPWSELLQYALIILAAALSPSLSAYFRWRERERDRRAEGNGRIVIEQYRHPMLLTFEPDQFDEIHTATVVSLTPGLLLAPVTRKRKSRDTPSERCAATPSRSVQNLRLQPLMGGDMRSTAHLRGTSLSVSGTPGRIRVDIKLSSRLLAPRIIEIHNPAKQPLPSQDSANTTDAAETERSS